MALFLEDGAGSCGSNGPGPCHLIGIGLGGRVALALARDHVQELRALQLPHVAQGRDQRLHIVAVHRADVVESHLLEQRAGQHHAFQVLLRAARQLPHSGHLAQHVLAAFAQVRVHAAGQRARELIRSAPTFSEIDMSLSFRMTSRSVGSEPA